MKIYVIRHGKTRWNELGKIQGRTDIELNDTGKNQATKIRKKIEELNIDVIISSNLTRAIQTAQIINKNMNLPIMIDERIIERNYGDLEGMDKHNFDFSEFWDWNTDVKYKNAETMQELFKRLRDFFEDIKVKYNDKNVLLVTHGGTIRAINYIMNPNLTLEQINNMTTKNCEIREYEL